MVVKGGGGRGEGLLFVNSPHPSLPSLLAFSSPGAASNVRQTRVVEKVSGRLLVAAVADPSERVRTAVLQALAETTALDDYMAQVWGEDGVEEGGICCRHRHRRSSTD